MRSMEPAFLPPAPQSDVESVGTEMDGMGAETGKAARTERLLRGATDTSFAVQIGDLAWLPATRYVVTLDADTDLPLDAGRKLVGTLAHPLNRARFDASGTRVVEGYGILQPRVAISALCASATPFADVLSGHVGLDPYTTAVSDVYQDVFGEGSYVGKGIYDVDAFEQHSGPGSRTRSSATIRSRACLRAWPPAPTTK
jgi:cyclic beta-1,2-glucan synthetase